MNKKHLVILSGAGISKESGIDTFRDKDGLWKKHGDQLDCYQRALEAEGKKKVAARIIYYPVTQFIVEVK